MPVKTDRNAVYVCETCGREFGGRKRMYCDQHCKSRSRTVKRNKSGESWLYRIYDESDELLYIGHTIDPYGRMHAHKTKSQWWDQVHHTSWMRFPSKIESSLAESQAIRDESPAFNVLGM